MNKRAPNYTSVPITTPKANEEPIRVIS